jgi:integrase
MRNSGVTNSKPVGLTDAKIEGLKPPETGAIEYPDQVVPGLRVKIGAAGLKSFVLRTRVGAKVKVVTLGHYGPRFKLAEARKTARSVLVDFGAGKDPSVEFKQANALDRKTVAGLYVQWLRHHVSGLRSAKTVQRIFEVNILPALGERQAAAVERKDIIRLIDSIAYPRAGKATPVMARAVAAQLSSFFGWCVSRDEVPHNPCIGVRKPPPAKAGERVLADLEIKALWHVAGQEGWPFGDAIKLLLLTGARRSEVFEAPWAEFDLAKSMWKIPAERSKNGLAHNVPLSRPALDLISRLPRSNSEPLLFPAANGSGKAASGISKAKRRLEEALALYLGEQPEHWKIHDLRRTVSTKMQSLGVRYEVNEAVLNHISGAKKGVAGVYQLFKYVDEKRDALDKWADELMRICGR